jgi:hypothetical protein
MDRINGLMQSTRAEGNVRESWACGRGEEEREWVVWDAFDRFDVLFYAV